MHKSPLSPNTQKMDMRLQTLFQDEWLQMISDISIQRWRTSWKYSKRKSYIDMPIRKSQTLTHFLVYLRTRRFTMQSALSIIQIQSKALKKKNMKIKRDRQQRHVKRCYIFSNSFRTHLHRLIEVQEQLCNKKLILWTYSIPRNLWKKSSNNLLSRALWNMFKQSRAQNWRSLWIRHRSMVFFHKLSTKITFKIWISSRWTTIKQEKVVVGTLNQILTRSTIMQPVIKSKLLTHYLKWDSLSHNSQIHSRWWVC